MKEHICTPNPLMKYQQYLQVPHFLHLLPQTLYCHADSQDDFTTEPLLLLYRCQQSLPKTATTLHADMVTLLLLEAVPSVPQVVRGLPQSSVTLPLLCSPLHPPAKQLSRKQPDLIHSNQTSQVGRAQLFKISISF